MLLVAILNILTFFDVINTIEGNQSYWKRLPLKEKKKTDHFSSSSTNHKCLSSPQIVGSSILIIYDECRAGAWLIDFAKTRALPSGLKVNHRTPWAPGNHEEGFLYGIDQLILVSNSAHFN